MKILVIGGGGREHALVWKLKQSSSVDRIFCAPGNAGTAAIAENVAVSTTDLPQLLRLAKQNDVDLTVVGPDDPLAMGIVDFFTADRLRIFGPKKSAARLESSKIFAKELMRTQKVPTAQARTFSDSKEALGYCDELEFPVVIKADGLALGKGVIIAPDVATAKSTIEAMMNEARFGDAGRRIVIEEFLCGTECSLHALVDGKNYRLLESARDHKRAFDGDEGPNTGGMGAFSPADNWDAQLQSQFESEIMQPLLRGLAKERIAYRGRTDDYERRRARARVQLPIWGPGNASAPAANEIRSFAAVGSHDRRQARQSHDRLGQTRVRDSRPRLGRLSGEIRNRKSDLRFG